MTENTALPSIGLYVKHPNGERVYEVIKDLGTTLRVRDYGYSVYKDSVVVATREEFESQPLKRASSHSCLDPSAEGQIWLEIRGYLHFNGRTQESLTDCIRYFQNKYSITRKP